MQDKIYITVNRRIGQVNVPKIDPKKEEAQLLSKMNDARASGNWRQEAQAMVELGRLARFRGHPDSAQEWMEASAKLCRTQTIAAVLEEKLQ